MQSTMKTRRTRSNRAVWMLPLGLGLALAAGAPTSARGQGTVDDEGRIITRRGNPNLGKPTAPSYYIGIDSGSMAIWRVKMTGAEGEVHHFTGRIVSKDGGKIEGFNTNNPADEAGKAEVKGDTITFDFKAKGYSSSSGIPNFYWENKEGKCFEFHLSADGKPVPPERIHYTVRDWNPKKNPFVLCRKD